MKGPKKPKADDEERKRSDEKAPHSTVFSDATGQRTVAVRCGDCGGGGCEKCGGRGFRYE